jgi:hypothetical protein
MTCLSASAMPTPVFYRRVSNLPRCGQTEAADRSNTAGEGKASVLVWRGAVLDVSKPLRAIRRRKRKLHRLREEECGGTGEFRQSRRSSATQSNRAPRRTRQMRFSMRSLRNGPRIQARTSDSSAGDWLRCLNTCGRSMSGCPTGECGRGIEKLSNCPNYFRPQTATKYPDTWTDFRMAQVSWPLAMLDTESSRKLSKCPK